MPCENFMLAYKYFRLLFLHSKLCRAAEVSLYSKLLHSSFQPVHGCVCVSVRYPVHSLARYGQQQEMAPSATFI